MDKEQKCSIVKDLVPAYEKREVSESTKEFVNTHLSECSECSNYYNDYKQKLNEENNKNNKLFTKTAKKMRHKKRKIIIVTIVSVIAVIAIWNCLFKVTRMYSSSMKPEIGVGEHCFISKMSYKFQEPKADDIVYVHFSNMEMGNEMDVKRIVGCPGDKVLIKNGVLYVNGDIYKRYKDKHVGTGNDNNVYSVKLGKDEYFLMGDNVDNSYDSRQYGAVTRDDIEAKVLF